MAQISGVSLFLLKAWNTISSSVASPSAGGERTTDVGGQFFSEHQDHAVIIRARKALKDGAPMLINVDMERGYKPM
jgi:hypothetical protein